MLVALPPPHPLLVALPGYCALFTVVWPLTPLVCLLCAAVESRCAAFRLAALSQRPVPMRVGGLGAGDAWASVLHFIAWGSCFVNCAVVGLSTGQLDILFSTGQLDFLFASPRAGAGAGADAERRASGGGAAGGGAQSADGDRRLERVLVAVAAEHVLLLAKWLVQALAPDSPELLLDDARKVEAQFAAKYGAAQHGGWDAHGTAGAAGCDSHGALAGCAGCGSGGWARAADAGGAAGGAAGGGACGALAAAAAAGAHLVPPLAGSLADTGGACGGHGGAGAGWPGWGWRDPGPASAILAPADGSPVISAIAPANGPVGEQIDVVVSGRGFGRAVVRGQVTLRLAPAAGGAVGAATLAGCVGAASCCSGFFGSGGLAALPLRATFLSDAKLRVTLPAGAVTGAGLASLSLELPPQPPPLPPLPHFAHAPPVYHACTPSSAPAGGTHGDATTASVAFEAAAATGTSTSVQAAAGAAAGTPRTPTAAAAAAAALAAAAGRGGCAGACFRFYPRATLSRLRPSRGALGGGTTVRLIGARFSDTREVAVRVALHGVQTCVPGAFISESEVRFLSPRFADSGTARMSLSLNNGQQWEEGELAFEYVHERCELL